MEKHRIIISGFPLIGKSCFRNQHKLTVSDSDSTQFSWIEKDIKRNPDFPNNYIEHIKNNKKLIILASSHKIVREALIKNNLNFILIYPNKNLKKEYLKRAKKRNDNDSFISKLNINWDNWLDDLNASSQKKIILKEKEYLGDAIFKNDEFQI